MAAIENDTIVAISTPPGRGGIAIVRLSGPRARDIAAPMLRLRHHLEPGRARFGELLDLTLPKMPSSRAKDPHGGAEVEGSPHFSWSGPQSPRDEWDEAPRVLDEIVVTYFAAPHSYTGEDVLEIAMHGAPVVLQHVVRQCCAPGPEGIPAARLAEPGEFTQRAFLAGRIDLTQAEAVGDLIESSTLEQARVAARQMGGALARAVAAPKAELVALIAAMEAGIDFAEDDIDVLPSEELSRRIILVRNPLAALERSFSTGRILRDGFSLAIVGRPNAGKSSLFNRLVQRERAIVTATPGTTRDLVTETVAIDGIPVQLIDTAGLRNREDLDEAERLGIAKSREAMADADLVLLVIDASSSANNESLTQDDRAVLDHARESHTAILIARNKVDLARSRPTESQPVTGPCPIHRADSPRDEWDRATTHDAVIPSGTLPQRGAVEEPVWSETKPSRTDPPHLPLPPTSQQRTQSDPCTTPSPLAPPPNPEPRPSKLDAIPTSALTGEGIPELRAAILHAVAGDTPGMRESGMVTSLRQHQAIQHSLRGLDAADSAIASATPHEMVLLDLYEALRGVDALTGVTSNEDVLRLIFSTFCIGK